MRHFSSESGESKDSSIRRLRSAASWLKSSVFPCEQHSFDYCLIHLRLRLTAAEGRRSIARMNMILHDFPTANVVSGNMLFDPKFKDGERLRTYDYVAANPPFPTRPGLPALRPGRTASTLHLGCRPRNTATMPTSCTSSLCEESGKAACILPHGVLFRGFAKERLQTQPPALHRQLRALRFAGH